MHYRNFETHLQQVWWKHLLKDFQCSHYLFLHLRIFLLMGEDAIPWFWISILTNFFGRISLLGFAASARSFFFFSFHCFLWYAYCLIFIVVPISRLSFGWHLLDVSSAKSLLIHLTSTELGLLICNWSSTSRDFHPWHEKTYDSFLTIQKNAYLYSPERSRLTPSKTHLAINPRTVIFKKFKATPNQKH